MVASLRATYMATAIGVARMARQVEWRRCWHARDALDADVPHEGVEAGRHHDPDERQLTFAVVLNVMRRTARHVDQESQVQRIATARSPPRAHGRDR